MAAESYQRAYGSMVSVQMLAELEEVIQYKLKPEKRNIIYKVWWDRLQVITIIELELDCIYYYFEMTEMSKSC